MALFLILVIVVDSIIIFTQIMEQIGGEKA